MGVNVAVATERTVGGVATPEPVGIAVLDADERPVALAAAADESAADTAAAGLLARCRAMAGEHGCAILISPDYIRVYNGCGESALATLSTPEVLGAYHDGFGHWRITPRYLSTLAEAWLSDVSYGWRGGRVPGVESLAATGLVTRLRRGAVHVVPDEQGSLRP